MTRLAEPLCALAVAADAGMGMPMDHALRSAAAAVRVGEVVGAPDAARAGAYYLALLRYVGCTADSDVAAEVFGDEVAVRGALYGVDWGAPGQVIGRLARAVGATESLRGAGRFAAALAGMPRLFDTGVAHCEVGDRLASRLGFDADLRAALFHTFERWDGSGFPRKLRGEAIALPMRLAQAGEEVEYGHRLGGVDGMLAHVRGRAGSALDPSLVERIVASPSTVCAELEAASPWSAALDAEVGAHRTLDDDGLDEVLRAVGDFADLKSRFTRAHSSGVADLARAAAGRLRLDAGVSRTLWRAGLLHDLGRVAVSAGVWDKPGPLNDGEWERVRSHTYVGERILARASSLAPIAELATLDHERLDGSGYHRRLAGASCTVPARVLAAADVDRAMTEARAHRPARGPDEAGAALTELGRSGLLCPEAVEAVLAVSGHGPRPRARPTSLTDREVEVLRLVARGMTNKEVAAALDISTKTAGHHLQHVFEKVGVTTRAAATMFAMQHGLVA